MWTLSNKPYMDFLVSIESRSIDVIFTDPPYDSMDAYRSIGTTTRLKNFFNTITKDNYISMFDEFYRITKQDSLCFVMCNQTAFFDFHNTILETGWYLPKLIVWDKINQGMGYHYHSRYEFIMCLSKFNVDDITEISGIRVKRVTKGYPTQKPVETISTILKHFNNTTVLDPFMGSGSTGIACLKTQNNFIGNDVSNEAVALATARLKEYANGH